MTMSQADRKAIFEYKAGVEQWIDNWKWRTEHNLLQNYGEIYKTVVE